MHKSSFKALTLTALAAFVLAACQGGTQSGQQAETEADTLLAPEPEAVPDTLHGFIGDDTSMNLIQLVTDEGDTLELELSDATERNATLEVGNHVAVAVRTEADSTLTVLATYDDPLPPEGNDAAIR